jgi:hypothetical protein
MIGKEETIHISWAHHGSVDAYFAYSLLDIVKMFPTHVSSYNGVQGLGLLSKSRNQMVTHFLDNTEDDWLLMVDSDEYITIDAFAKIVNTADAHEYPFVCGLYFAANWKTPEELEPVPLIFTLTEEDGVQPYFDYPRDQIVDIYAAGTGCMFIHRSVLEDMRDKYWEEFGRSWAWFQDGPIGEGKWLSEDLAFCDRVNSAGIRIVAHTGAIIPHRKTMWLMESHYDTWLRSQDIK